MHSERELALQKTLDDLKFELQKALDAREHTLINKIMSHLFLDYSDEYADDLIRYNEECDIKASDWVKIKVNFPTMTAFILSNKDEQFIKGLCEVSEEELELMNSFC